MSGPLNSLHIKYLIEWQLLSTIKKDSIKNQTILGLEHVLLVCSTVLQLLHLGGACNCDCKTEDSDLYNQSTICSTSKLEGEIRL